MTAPDVSHGKAFEKECTVAFGKMYERYRCRWERTLDSASAGSIVRSADSDFRLLAASPRQGCPFLFYVECKASVLGKSFNSYFRSLVKSNQNASLHAARRGGAEAFVLYKDIANGVIEVWRGRDVNAFYPDKRKPIDTRCALRLRIDQLDRFATFACSLPLDLLTLLESTHHADWTLF